MNNLKGSIPASLGNLSSLAGLRFDSGNLTSMTELSAFSNRLSGSLPREFSNLTQLQVLSLANNSLSGELPSDICRQGNLQQLVVSVNMLTGPIPRGLRACRSLRAIDIDGNQITGDISGFGPYPHLFFARVCPHVKRLISYYL